MSLPHTRKQLSQRLQIPTMIQLRAFFGKVIRLCIQVSQLALLCLCLPFLMILMGVHLKRRRLNKDGRIQPAGGIFILRVVVEYILWNYDRPNYEVSAELAKRYEGANVIFKNPLSGEALIHLTDLQSAKEVMGPSCSSTWVNRLGEGHYGHKVVGGKPIGLLVGCGEHWTQPRRIALRLLHKLDFFRLSRMESQIQFEINELKGDLLKKIERARGSLTFSPSRMFEFSTMNSVCQVLIGRRYERDDPLITKIMDSVHVANRNFIVGYNPLEFVPFLGYFHFLLPSLRSIGSASSLLIEFFKEIVEAKRTKGTYKLQPENFVDHFLQEIDKCEGKNPYITDDGLLAALRDLILAGMDTTASALEHGLLHVSLQPQIQRRVQEEIDEIIGDRSPVYEDRLRMPYTQAVLLEILRIGSVVPITARSPVAHTKFEEYRVPKGSLCGINLYAIHRDPKLWEEPDEFRPDRFLSQGNDPVIVNTEKIIPFGYGKRNCIGETLARCTLFIFFVTMLQNFNFRISESHPPPSMGNVHGLTRCPMPHFLVATKR